MKRDIARKMIACLMKCRSAVRRRRHLLAARVLSFASAGTFAVGIRIKLHVPVRCDGKGRVVLGNEVLIGCPNAPKVGDGEVLLQARSPESVISIGDRTAVSNNVQVVAVKAVVVGSDCLIGDGVTIMDSDCHDTDPELRHRSCAEPASVTIGRNVWLGSRVMVMKGVGVGDNSVIGAGSVVVTSIPGNVVAAGVPARVVREL